MSKHLIQRGDNFFLRYQRNGRERYTQIRTGDFLLIDETGCKCSCKGLFLCFLGSCIKCCSDSKYTHVGMIIIDPTFGPVPLKGAYFLQSTGLDKIRDVEDNQQKFGVQLDRLDQALDEIHGHVYYRKVHVERNAEFYRHLSFAHSVVHNRPYDDNPIDWVKSLFDDKKGRVHKKKTFFCSALVSYMLASIGVMAMDTDWTIIRPKDLGSEPGHRFSQFMCNVDREIKVF